MSIFPPGTICAVCEKEPAECWADDGSELCPDCMVSYQNYWDEFYENERQQEEMRQLENQAMEEHYRRHPHG